MVMLPNFIVLAKCADILCRADFALHANWCESKANIQPHSIV